MKELDYSTPGENMWWVTHSNDLSSHEDSAWKAFKLASYKYKINTHKYIQYVLPLSW